MEKANRETEVFALENNISSDKELILKANRLKEFKEKIIQINLSIQKLSSINNLIQLENFDPIELDKLLSQILVISPRLKPLRRFLNDDGSRDLGEELNFYKTNLPLEIRRQIEAEKITKDGFRKLEEEAKKASIDIRKLRSLEMESTFRTTSYQALIKEFETQSIVDGYKEAMGEIYETAKPLLANLVRSQFK